MLLTSAGLLAQQKMVSGTVSDDQGVPLPGATIIIKETSSGAVTDFDGNYSISATVGQTLVFSFVGYVSAEISIGASDTYNISLSPSNALDEVVVTSLGIKRQKKRIDLRNSKRKYGWY